MTSGLPWITFPRERRMASRGEGAGVTNPQGIALRGGSRRLSSRLEDTAEIDRAVSPSPAHHVTSTKVSASLQLGQQRTLSSKRRKQLMCRKTTSVASVIWGRSTGEATTLSLTLWPSL